jgi:SAM-dependent methyltransferase
MLEAIRAALTAEAKVREEVAGRVQAQHERLDLFGNMLEAARAALSAEAKVREEVAEGVQAQHERLEHVKSGMTFFQDLLSHLDERQVADSSYLKRELQLRVHDFARLSNKVGKVRRRKGKQDESVVEPDGDNDHAFDAFYLAFENKFRGTRADIKERVSVYLPLIKDAGLAGRQDPLLDLGCGRGEWLELLREEGLAGHGVDLNEFMVEECAARKLAVTQADVLHHLGSLRSNSQGVITAFHLIEHLPFPSLMSLFAETLRVLCPGGICIFETPNPDNIQVGSNRFYSDPTHLRPLPKDFTKFAMATVGFTSLEILPLHPDHNALPVSDGSPPIERFINQIFFGDQDYAVIGRK